MAQQKGKQLASKRSHAALWLAIVGSISLHFVFLWPTTNSSEPKKAVPVYPVILAELRQPIPTQALLQQSRSSSNPSSSSAPNKSVASEADQEDSRALEKITPIDMRVNTEPRVKPKTKPSQENDNRKTEPQTAQVETPATTNQTARSGLTISRELLSSDPIERNYQQQVLAHLRNRLAAPPYLSGSVRLEIQFRYRQIATQVQVIHSSGSPQLDDWAIKAVLSANPFPPLPAEIADGYIFRPTLRTAP